jgi:hypothetical protein
MGSGARNRIMSGRRRSTNTTEIVIRKGREICYSTDNEMVLCSGTGYPSGCAAGGSQKDAFGQTHEIVPGAPN